MASSVSPSSSVSLFSIFDSVEKTAGFALAALKATIGCGTLLIFDPAAYGKKSLGWILEARVHHGPRLSHFVGVSIFVQNRFAGFIARTSGYLLCFGVGAYLTYKLCCKLSSSQRLISLLQWIRNRMTDKLKTTVHQSPCRHCRRKDDGRLSTAGDSRRKDDELRRRRRRKFLNEHDGNFASCSGSSSESGHTNDHESDDKSVSTTTTSLDEVAHGSNENETDASPELTAKVTKSAVRARQWLDTQWQRTNALDIEIEHDSEDDDSLNGFSNSRSPPPILRTKTRSDYLLGVDSPAHLDSSKSLPAVSRTSSFSIPSSQQLAWDPVCTPNESPQLNEQLLSVFADIPSNELVQRFLNGVIWSNDGENRASSPGPSEAASEMSLFNSDRLLDDGTTENFERLQCDLVHLRSDVDEFNVELTSYLNERSQCLQSDSRAFYRSVILEEPEDEPTPSPTPSVSPRRRRSTLDAGDRSCNIKSPKKKKCANDIDSLGNSKHRRCRSDTPCDDVEFSSNIKSLPSFDAGYDSSGCMQISASTCSSDDAQKHPAAAVERPKQLKLMNESVDSCFSTDHLSTGSSEQHQKSAGKLLTADRRLASDQTGLTPDSVTWRARSPSAMSLEWEDEIATESPMAPSSVFEKQIRAGGVSWIVPVSELLSQFCQQHVVQSRANVNKFAQMLTGEGHHHTLLLYDNLKMISDVGFRDKADLGGRILSCLSGMCYRRFPIFRCRSFEVVSEAVEVTLKRFATLTASCMSYFGSTDREETRSFILQCMQKLWQLHQSVQQDEQHDKIDAFLSDQKQLLIDGVKLLMVLRSLEIYDELILRRKPPCAFYGGFFRKYTPMSFAEERLFGRTDESRHTHGDVSTVADLDIGLLADTLAVNVHLYDLQAQSVWSSNELRLKDAKTNRPLPMLCLPSKTGLLLPLV